MVFDYIVLGGGIVGLATAMQLQQRYPSYKILVIEKESQLAQHQTGHNSGVIHAGIYYQPGSFKARFCREGSVLLKQFCDQHAVPYRTTGKLVVATNTDELERLENLYQSSRENDVTVEYQTVTQLKELEPHIRGLGAILVRSTGIVDYTAVARAYAAVFQAEGGQICCGAEVKSLLENSEHVVVTTSAGSFTSRFLVVCAGLQADRLARLMSVNVDFAIVPIRGEYYQLPVQYNDRITRPIYPVPRPGVPFLGIHITPMINGRVTVGPNAVMGWKREGYDKVNFSFRDSWESFSYPGFWRMTANNWRHASGEMYDSWYKTGYLKKVQAYCPGVTLDDLKPYPAGIRAQAVNRQGDLLHDFLFGETPRSVHVCNAPSPAATASLPIGAYLCDKLADSGRY